jgi:hypothetical protein
LFVIYQQVFIKKEIQNLKIHILFVLIGIILVFGYLVGIKQYWGNTTIGSFFEKDIYTTQYYVNLFVNKDNVKSYRVKADIRADYIEYVDDKQRVYWIEKAYFNNGGYLTFYNEIENSNYHTSLEFNKKVSVIDDNGKEWFVELTDIKIGLIE